jgi:hypothetical protein
MAVNDELIRLVLELTGAATIEDATRKLAMMKGELQAVDVAQKATAGSSMNVGQSALAASYAVQDFTSQLGTRGLAGALGAIQNNIPQIIMGLGMSGGLTAVVSLLSVGVGLLASNWDKVQQLWGSGKTEEEIERLKKLKKALEDVVEATKKMLEGLNPQQKEGQDAVQKAVKAFGGKAVLDEVIKGLVADKGSAGADADKQLGTNLLGNAARGDIKAIEYLRQIMNPMGPIGGVIHGGGTPEEGFKTPALDKLDESAKKFREKQEADRLQRMEELAKMGPHEQTVAEKAQSFNERLKQSQDLEEAFRRATKQQQDEKNARQRAALPQQEMVPENATAEQMQAIRTQNRIASQLAQAMLGNQGQMTAQVEVLSNQLRQAQLITRQLQQNGNAMPNWQ